MRKKDLKLYLFLFVLFFLISLFYKLYLWLAGLPPIKWALILVLLVGAVMVRIHFKQRKRLREEEERLVALKMQEDLDELMKLNWLEFEEYIRDLFIQLGCEASLTSATGDGGKDIFIYKGDFFAVAECKRYSPSNKVTRPDIQKFHSAVIDCKADKGFFFTTSGYTKHAEIYVLDKPIILINGERLVKIVQGITRDEMFWDAEDLVAYFKS